MNAQHQLIHEYLDGNIEPYMEQTLFSQLSASEELRQEFANQMAVQKSAAADMRSIVAPDDAKQSVFAHLGLLPESTAADTVAPIVASGIWSRLSSRMMLVGGIALLALLAGGGSVWLGYEYGGWGASTTAQQQTLNGSSSSTSANNAIIEHQNNSGSELSTASHNNGMIMPQYHVLNIPADAYFTNTIGSEQEGTETAAVEQDAPSSQQPSLYTVNSLPSTAVVNSNQTMPGTLPQVRQNIRAQVVPTFNDNPFTLSVRGSSSMSALASSNTAFANGALTALYDVDGSHFVGVEFSNEYYNFVETRRVLGRDQQYEYSQAMPAFGFAYRYSAQALSFMNITPFGQAFSGVTTTGNALGRTAVGLEWFPERRIGLIVGVDAAIMQYRTQGITQTSIKPSLMYGVQVRF